MGPLADTEFRTHGEFLDQINRVVKKGAGTELRELCGWIDMIIEARELSRRDPENAPSRNAWVYDVSRQRFRTASVI